MKSNAAIALSVTLILAGCNSMPQLEGITSAFEKKQAKDEAAPTNAEDQQSELDAAANRVCSGPAPVGKLSLMEKIKKTAIEKSIDKGIKYVSGSEELYVSELKVDNTCTAEKVFAQGRKSIAALATVQKELEVKVKAITGGLEQLANKNVAQNEAGTNKDDSTVDLGPNKEMIENISAITNPELAKKAGMIAIRSYTAGSIRGAEVASNYGKAFTFAKTSLPWAIENSATLQAGVTEGKQLSKTALQLWASAKAVAVVIGIPPEVLEKVQKDETKKVEDNPTTDEADSEA